MTIDDTFDNDTDGMHGECREALYVDNLFVPYSGDGPNVGSFATLYVTLDADEERIDPQRCEGVIFCTNAHCDDGSLCTFDRCIDNVCVRTPSVRGDIAGPGGSCEADGGVDLSDILAVLDGFGGDFAEGCELVNIDIAGDEGSCDPNDIIDLSDITAVLDAFAGDRDCCTGGH